MPSASSSPAARLLAENAAEEEMRRARGQRVDIDACTLDLVTLAAEERLRAEGQKVPAEQNASQSSTMAILQCHGLGVFNIY